MYMDKKEITNRKNLVERIQAADKKLEEIRGKGSIMALPESEA